LILLNNNYIIKLLKVQDVKVMFIYNPLSLELAISDFIFFEAVDKFYRIWTYQTLKYQTCVRNTFYISFFTYFTCVHLATVNQRIFRNFIK